MFSLSSLSPNSEKTIQLKWLVVGGAVLFVVGLAFGRYTLPAKVVTKTEIQIVEKEKIVEKIVEKKSNKEDSKQNENKKQQIHIVETRLPDGTYKKETFILNEDTKYVEVTKSQTEEKVTDKTSEKEKKIDQKTETLVQNDVNTWRVSALAGINYGKEMQPDFRKNITYGAVVERKVIGPVYLGGYGTTSKEVGVSVGLQF